MLKKLILHCLAITVCFFSLLSSDVAPGYVVELPSVDNYVSPSERYNTSHSMRAIDRQLSKFGASQANKVMFAQMIANEAPGFFGYHAGCSDYRIFQDVIKIAIEECLGISIRSDFQFLRVPGLSEYSFQSADEFLLEHPTYNDNLDPIKKHILSLNIALYNSHDAEWDFTPRYFLQNRPWTHVHFERQLAPFFDRLGIHTSWIHEIFKLARQHIPQHKGMILQFFDRSHQTQNASAYQFLDRHAYVGHSHGCIQGTSPSQCYLTAMQRFPQLRFVLSNRFGLNPNSPLMILRYSTLSADQEAIYLQELREMMRALPIDRAAAELFRDELLSYWYP